MIISRFCDIGNFYFSTYLYIITNFVFLLGHVSVRYINTKITVGVCYYFIGDFLNCNYSSLTLSQRFYDVISSNNTYINLNTTNRTKINIAKIICKKNFFVLLKLGIIIVSEETKE